jgi:hypothetical protein
MRIEFERSGGIAGMRIATRVELDSLTAQEADEVCKLVDDAGFFDLPTDVTSPQALPDQYAYKVTVETQAQRHTVETDDGAAPQELRPLLQWLSRAARRSRRSGTQ